MDVFMGNLKLYLVDKLCGKFNWFNEWEYIVCVFVGFFIYLYCYIWEVIFMCIYK